MFQHVFYIIMDHFYALLEIFVYCNPEVLCIHFYVRLNKFFWLVIPLPALIIRFRCFYYIMIKD